MQVQNSHEECSVCAVAMDWCLAVMLPSTVTGSNAHSLVCIARSEEHTSELQSQR